MKKALLIAAICFITKTSMAQFNTALTMLANPPGTLIDWDNKTLTYIIAGGTGVILEAKIKTEIKTLDGTVAATIDLNRAKRITVGGNSLILYVEDVMPLDVMIFSGKFKTSLERSGKLPADNYQICVQLVNPTDYRPLSEAKCRNFNIAAFQLPVPVMPANESILDVEKAKTAITFRWTPVTPNTGQVLTYRVTVFEILENQTPMQALRSNQPLLAKDIMGTTQYIWQPQLSMTKCCTGDPDFDLRMKKDTIRGVVHGDPDFDLRMKKDTIRGIGPDMEPDAYAFIWTIQTFDILGRPFGDGNVNGDGISEPNVFFIDRRPAEMKRSGPPSRTIFLNNMKPKRN